MSTPKRGATAINISYLIGLIALFLVLYMILIPEPQKEAFLRGEDILDDAYPSYQGTLTGGLYPSTFGGLGFNPLISESPGLVKPALGEVFIKPLASASLFSELQEAYSTLATTATIESTRFTEDKKEYRFTINDYTTLANAQLLLFVISTENDITITINGNEIFNGQLTNQNMPLDIPSSLLRGNNILTFIVKKPSFIGLNSKNTYQLKDIVLIQHHLNQNTIETRSFTLNERELDGLTRLTAFYAINCFTVNEEGRLVITLNGRPVQDNLVVCDAGQISLDLPIPYLQEGRNALTFEIDQGKYIIEQLFLEGETLTDDFDAYYFTLQVIDIQALAQGARVGLGMKFLDDGYRKAGTLYINGYPLYYDARGREFFQDITGLVKEGENTVRIIPRTASYIEDLTVAIY